MDLSIVIVSYNVKEKLKKNLESIFSSHLDFNWEVFVIDNNSSDGSAEMVEKNFPQVKLIKNEDNLGFSKANNIAIKRSQGDFILLLNPDMQVFPETLRQSLSYARKNPRAIVSSCLLVDSNGETIKHVRRFPRLFDQLAIILKLPHLFPKITKKYLYLDFDYSKTQVVDSVRGSFFLINRKSYSNLSAASLPLLDERYFLWFEEVDFCRQIHEWGGEIHYNHEARCLDYLGQSFSLLKRGRAQKYFSDSMLKYFKKWQAPWQFYLLSFFWPLGKFLTFIFSPFQKKN